MARLSLSTNWNSRSGLGGTDLVRTARTLGLSRLELGYALTNRQADELRPLVASGEIEISSVHAFCPVPMGVSSGHPELFSICEPSERARIHAVAAVKNTARFALEMGAPVVVLHAGRVGAVIRAARKIQDLAEKGVPASDPKFDRKREALILKRDRKAPKHLDALRLALDELVPWFEDHRLVLGLENLPTYDAMPTESEMFSLLQDYESPALAAWHDIGHGQVRANLGFIHHASVLRRFAPHLGGLHVHDVLPPADDHMMPPQERGTVDFPALSFLGELPIPAVLEPAPGTPPESVARAVDYLRAAWPALT